MIYKIKIRIISILLLLTIGVLTTEAQEKFSRGIEQQSFVPEGQIVTGLSASYSQSNQNNYQFLIAEDITGSTYSVKVSPMFCYIFHDNLGAGGRVAYSRSRTKLDKATIVLDSDNKYDVDNVYSINQNFSAMGIFRNYISLGNTKRFGLYAEVQLELGTGASKLTNGSGTDFTGTYSKNYSVNLGVSPGLIVFLNNYSALEVNVGVLGFGYTHNKLTTNQVEFSDFKSTSANFKINLFSIAFGVAFYL